MDEEGTTTTHLIGLLGVEIERAGSGDRGIVHGVLAVAELILSSGQWTSVHNALHLRVHVSIILARVPMSVDSPLTRATMEMASVLIVSVGHLRTSGEGLAALGQASTFLDWGEILHLGSN